MTHVKFSLSVSLILFSVFVNLMPVPVDFCSGNNKNIPSLGMGMNPPGFKYRGFTSPLRSHVWPLTFIRMGPWPLYQN